ncbi:cytochrome C [Sphingosinicella xenopeptidilytica]|uniref:Cytochrome C n=1 Tax=Sphingosinicella xenopeptidilytica TaxID=364098 RepID=A0ABW3C6L4_SPHXN
MLRGILALAALAGVAGAGLAAQGVTRETGVSNPALARQNWILKCQGCHRPDATGTAQTTPAMAGVVAKFLHVPGGREYLGRVPGVATAPVGDAELADLLNWTLYRFDGAHVPADFKPYTAAEVGKLRRAPLRTEAPVVRAALMAKINALAEGGDS